MVLKYQKLFPISLFFILMGFLFLPRTFALIKPKIN